MSAGSKFFYWLRGKRKATGLRAQTPNGERTIQLETTRRRFTEAEECLKSIGATSCEALDGKGNTLAAFAFVGDEDGDEVLSEQLAAEETKKKAILEAAAKDAESQRMIVFSQLIADAYKHSTTVAFQKLAEIVQIQNEHATVRSQAYEKALSHMEKVTARLAAQNAKLQGAATDEEPDGLGGLVETFIGAKIQGEAAAAAAAAAGAASKPTNGKAKTT